MRTLFFFVATLSLWGLLLQPGRAQSSSAATGANTQGAAAGANSNQSGQASATGQAASNGQANTSGTAGQNTPTGAATQSGASVNQTGNSAAVNQTGPTATTNQTGPTAAVNQTSPAAAKNQTGPTAAVNQTGPTASVNQTGPTAAGRTNAQTNSLGQSTQRQLQQGQPNLSRQQFEALQRADRNLTGMTNDRLNAADRLAVPGQVNANNMARGAFRFDDRPDLRDSLRRRGLQTEDWRVVSSNGGYWYWTPNRTWLFFNNGNWVDYTPGMGLQPGVTLPYGYPQDNWRLVQNNGRYWFYTPDQSWLYYDNGNWVTYPVVGTVGTSRVATFPPGYPNDNWRLVFHDGRWWFWSPDQVWLYRDRDHWITYRGGQIGIGLGPDAQRQSVGFRGLEGQPTDAGVRMDGQLQNQPSGDMQQNQSTFRQQQPGNMPSQPGSAPGAGAGQGMNTTGGQSGNIIPPPQPPTPTGDAQRSPAEQTGAINPSSAGPQLGR